MVTEAPERWTYTPEEVAQRMGVSTQTVREQCREGKIRTVRFGRLYLVTRAEVARLIGEDPRPHEIIDTGRAEREENERLRNKLLRIRNDIDDLLA